MALVIEGLDEGLFTKVASTIQQRTATVTGNPAIMGGTKTASLMLPTGQSGGVVYVQTQQESFFSKYKWWLLGGGGLAALTAVALVIRKKRRG